ncbi:ATP-binding cassette domain-containing protein [Thermodesulfobium sp. 4217-1]|uniref:ABC transporter ATP-binding protein n=1 Tax=Thermodesulfobium sp. 4217-1 TaxID=3120013 RepID=UPI003221CD71
MLKVNIFQKLSNFDLQICFEAENQVLVLFGPSGCGKTTTLKLLSGLRKLHKGSIVFKETAFADTDKGIFISPQKRKFSMMFQDYALFPHLSVYNNILYGSKKNKVDHLRAQELMSKFNITQLKDSFPLLISGGERQRVALARALMTEPNAILLDEPLSALDSETRVRLGEEIRNFQESFNILFILVTHDKEEANRIGDRIIYLNSGRITNDVVVQH